MKKVPKWFKAFNNFMKIISTILILFLAENISAKEIFWQPFEDEKYNSLGYWIQNDSIIVNVRDDAFKNTQIYTLKNLDKGIIICTLQFYLVDFNPVPNYTTCFNEVKN